jgi:hypothetical protein
MTEQGTPNAATTYADIRKQRADRPSVEFISAKNYPNGLQVKVVRTEVGLAFDRVTPAPVWVITSEEIEGEKKLNESGFMTGKLEDLDIADPTGRSFVLAQEDYKGQKTFRIARAL